MDNNNKKKHIQNHEKYVIPGKNLNIMYKQNTVYIFEIN